MIDGDYPQVIDELKTLELMHKGKSISRFGDGEFNLINGEKCSDMNYGPTLLNELKSILKIGTTNNCLVAIPPINDARITNADWWAQKRQKRKYTSLIDKNMLYYSSYVSRPDIQPYLNTKEYYESVTNLWRNKDIILVGSVHPIPMMPNSLRPEIMSEAKSIQFILGHYKHAYRDINRIEEEIGQTDKSVILCFGATATILAWRLSQKGIVAWDLGHIGTSLVKFNNK